MTWEWSKPCPGRDALRAGRRTYEGKPCPRCGFTTKYCGSACVECVRLAAYLARCVPEGWSRFRKELVEPEARAVADHFYFPEVDAIRFLLASIVLHQSGSRIATGLDMSLKKAGSYARRCRDMGLWNDRHPKSMNYEWLKDECDIPDFCLLLDAMVLTEHINRTGDGRYFPGPNATDAEL
jgi:hypothetical protein